MGLTIFKILLLEDNPPDAELVLRELKKADFVCDTLVVNCKADYIKAICEFSPDLILSDHALPSFTSLEALEIAIEKLAKVPFILVTGTMTEEFAVKVMKQGAWDYVPKNDLRRLPDAVRNAMDKFNSTKLRQKFLYDLILNEAYMQEAESMAHYGSWEVDLIARKLKFSKEAYNILGYQSGALETLFENILSIVHPEELVHIRNLANAIINEPKVSVYTENVRIIDKDELYKVIQIKFLLKHDLQGRLLRITGFMQNVTDSFIMEEKLIESAARYSCLADSVETVSIFSLNSEGYVISSNNQAEALFGYTSQEILNKHISILYKTSEYYDSELKSHLKIASDIGKFATKSCFTSKNGSKLWTNTIITSLHNKSGNLFGYIITARRLPQHQVSTEIISN